MAEVIMLLAENHREIVQGGMVGPQIAGEGGILGRDREQGQMIDRQHGPQQQRNADQQQLGLGCDAAEREFHFDSRFIMKNTSGSTSGSAQTIAAIERSTASSRR